MANHPGDILKPFILDDAAGTPVSLEQIVESGPAVIVFYRGGWCPYCNLALRTYQQNLLPSWTPSVPGSSPSARSHRTSHSPLSKRPPWSSPSSPTPAVVWPIGSASPSSRLTNVLAAQRKLGLDLTKVNADGALRLPRPTVLVVDQDRIVRFVDVQPDYTARTELTDIIAALTDLT